MLLTENGLEEISQHMFSQNDLVLVGFVVVLFNQAFFFLIFPPLGKLIHSGRLLL